MKKAGFLLIILSISIIETIAQTETFKPVSSFGIRQGANVSFVDFSPTVREGLVYGYNGGLVYRYVNEKLFALQIELNFSQKGWIEDFDTIPNSYNRKLNYIELPFMTQIYIGSRKVSYYANLGTAVAYMISEKETLTIENEDYTREYYKRNIENKFDYSVVAELGLRYDTNIGAFNFGIRYYYTISDLFTFDADNTYEISRNQVINVSLTYFLTSK